MSKHGHSDRPRAREAGLIIGEMDCGPLNAISDVDAVRVGQVSVCLGDAGLDHGEGQRSGEGIARTGLTLILPHGEDLYRNKVRAAVHTINGYGKAMGLEQLRELGLIESPIALTNTFNVGLVADALVRLSVERDQRIGSEPDSASLNVVVGETNDGYLNELAGRHVRYEHAAAAWAAALGPEGRGLPAEGSVGAGTGTSCFGWKGGIGTASRVVPGGAGGYTVGALVQSNFGGPGQLCLLGFPVGERLQGRALSRHNPERGSIMIVLATDAPLSERQLGRLCVRAGAALARLGGQFGHGSGDFVIAFSTAYTVPHSPSSLCASFPGVQDEEKAMRWLFPAVIESVEEAVINSLFKATTMRGRDGHERLALPLGPVLELLEKAGLLQHRL